MSHAHDILISKRVFQAHEANKKRREDDPYEVGTLVYLSTENLNLPKQRAHKLNPKYIGPFKITIAHPETSTYTLELTPELKR